MMYQISRAIKNKHVTVAVEHWTGIQDSWKTPLRGNVVNIFAWPKKSNECNYLHYTGKSKKL